MGPVFRYAWGCWALAIALMLAGATSVAAAGFPAGPRLAISVFGSGTKARDAVIAVGPSGRDLRVLVSDPRFFGVGDRVSWSADGSLLAFAAIGSSRWPLLGIATEGGNSRVFPRAFLNAGEPVLAPNGRTAYFARAKLVKVLPGRENYLFKSSIWSLSLKNHSVKRRTEWQLGIPLVPSSLSPDGLSLAGTRETRDGPQAVAANLHTGRVTVLAREAFEPIYSPDGSRVAFVRWRNWRASGVDNGSPPINELRVTRVGAFPRSRLLLRSRKLLAWPSWDPSGSRLAFTLSHVVENGYSTPERGDKVMAINADGSCLRKVFSDPEVVLYGAAWQPGPGREAGRIEC